MKTILELCSIAYGGIRTLLIMAVIAAVATTLRFAVVSTVSQHEQSLIQIEREQMNQLIAQDLRGGR
jgi:Na+-translocating ferredoxin:NAD+ oxidoreductase RnfG subunit